MSRKSGAKDPTKLEEKAWREEPPRSSRSLSQNELFARAAITWARNWLQRHHHQPNFAKHRPFVIVLSSSLLVESEPLLAALGNSPTPLGVYPYPVTHNVLVTTEVVRHAAGATVGATQVDTLIIELSDRAFGSRSLLLVDPATHSVGVHDPEHNLMDIQTMQIPTDSAPVLSIESVDALLTRFHKEIVRLPKQWIRTYIWRNPADDTCFETVEKPEHVIHSALYVWLMGIFSEERIHTDYEAQVASGRADIRILEALANELWWMWLELKVLREADGPGKRQYGIEECIAQARARFEDKPKHSKGAFACCYDASKSRLPFSAETIALAAKSPEVQLRQYEVLRKLYDVAAAQPA